MLAEVRGAGGEVFGVVAQGQAAADQAKEAWGLGFEQWSDPQVEIATHMNDVGMASIEIDVEFARSMSKAVHTDTGEIPGGAYEVGVLQPAIVVVEKGQPDTALVSWSSVSASHNIGGAVGRPPRTHTDERRLLPGCRKCGATRPSRRERVAVRKKGFDPGFEGSGR